MPSSPSAPPDFLTRRPFAHRGLHGNGIVENSRAAFAAAIAGGYGIELDIQVSGDGVPFVFHDGTLDRLTGETGALAARDAASLDRVRLAEGGETLPRLAEILALVGRAAPILVEVKAPGRWAARLAQAVAADLKGFDGEAAVMSFNPDVGRWFGLYEPDRVRGLATSEQERGGLFGRLERRLALAAARPHFLAVDVRDLPSAFVRAEREAGRPILTWTVRNGAQRAVAAAHADQIIFEQAA